MLIGNKTDLAKMREVQTEDAANYAEREQMALIETSALDSSNVNLAFECIIKGKLTSSSSGFTLIVISPRSSHFYSPRNIQAKLEPIDGLRGPDDEFNLEQGWCCR